MKRRLISLFMMIILVLSFSINASAASTSTSGQTTGGTGSVTVTATLNVYSTAANASTAVSPVGATGYTVSTGLIYYCILPGGGTTPVVGTGTDTHKSASYEGIMGYLGKSYHSVYGGGWGSWSRELSIGV